MNMSDGFEIYHVTYKPILFGSTEEEKKYGDSMHFLVSTRGGRRDAELACKKYHPNCLVEEVQSRLEDVAGIHINRKLREEKAEPKKKRSKK